MGKGGEDRPNAVTLITLRLPRVFRLCQLAIVSFTRWPFLNPTQPRSDKAHPRRAIIRARGTNKVFCTLGYALPTFYIRRSAE